MRLFAGSHLPERMLANLGDGATLETDLADRDHGHLAACDRCRRLRDGHGMAARLLASPWSAVALPAAVPVVRLAPLAAVGPATARPRSRLTMMVALAAVILTMVIAFLAAVAGSRPPTKPDELLGKVDATATPSDRIADATTRPQATPATISGRIVVIAPSPRPDICMLFGPDDAAILMGDEGARVSLGTPFSGGSFVGRGDGCVYEVTRASHPGQFRGVRARLEIKATGGTVDDARQAFATDLESTSPDSRTAVRDLADQAVIATGYLGKADVVYRQGGNETMDWEQIAVIRVRDGATYFEIRVDRTGDGGSGDWSSKSASGRRLPSERQLEMIARRALLRLHA